MMYGLRVEPVSNEPRIGPNIRAADSAADSAAYSEYRTHALQGATKRDAHHSAGRLSIFHKNISTNFLTLLINTTFLFQFIKKCATRNT